jgi:hypothetical protein
VTATATKPATTKGPVPAAVAAKASDGATTLSTSGTFKFLAWVLLVLNLLTAGGWLYLKFFQNSKSDGTLRTTRNRLLSLTKNVESLHGTVRYIAQNSINEVTDLGTGLVGRVKVTFLNRRVYKFASIVDFLTRIEMANPTVQIKDIDFGRRIPEAVGSDTWVPTIATVRALQIATN